MPWKSSGIWGERMLVFWKHRYLWYALLLVAAIALRIILAILRRRTVEWDARSNELDLADLQRLVEQGQMSMEEFEKTKAVILSRRNRGNQEPGRAMGFPVFRPMDQGKSKQN